MNEALHVGVGRSDLGDSHGHANVGLFELLLALIMNPGANAVDNDVLVADDVLKLLLVREVL